MIKLSQRDIKLGDKFTWGPNDTDGDYQKGDIIEIVKITGTEHSPFPMCSIKNHRTGKVEDYTLSTIQTLSENVLKIIKPHEFSPVNMTGRYKTIGD